jgi:hypothetical protein
MPEYATESAQVYPAWFSYKEAEIWSGLSRTTLWLLITSGHVKAAHVGRAVRISRQSMEHYMVSQTKKDVVDSGRSPHAGYPYLCPAEYGVEVADA